MLGILIRDDFRSQAARREPFINKIICNKAIKFFKQYVHVYKEPLFLKHVLFLDENNILRMMVRNRYRCFAGINRVFIKHLYLLLIK